MDIKSMNISVGVTSTFHEWLSYFYLKNTIHACAKLLNQGNPSMDGILFGL